MQPWISASISGFPYIFCLLSTARYTDIELSFYTKPSLMHLLHVAAWLPFTHWLYKYTQVILNLLLIFQHLFTFTKLIYRWLLLSSPFDWAICSPSLYLIPHINRSFFPHANTLPLSDMFRPGFHCRADIIDTSGYFSPVQYQGVASLSLLLKRCCPTPGSQSYVCYQPYTARVSSLCRWALIRL